MHFQLLFRDSFVYLMTQYSATSISYKGIILRINVQYLAKHFKKCAQEISVIQWQWLRTIVTKEKGQYYQPNTPSEIDSTV